MLLQVYVRTETGERLAGLSEVLGLQDSAYLSVDDMLARLLGMQAAGLIRIDPSPESLQRLAIRASIQTFLRQDRDDDGIRRYVSDRRGGRINRTARRVAELDEIHRREAVASIQRFMMTEGPAAYRSQAQLLAIFDPTADPELIARQAASQVGDAVRRGMSEGRATLIEAEQAS